MYLENLQQEILTRLDEILSVLQQIPKSYKADRRPDAGALASFQECYAATVSLGSSIYGRDSLQVSEFLSSVQGLRKTNPYPGNMDGRIAAIAVGFIKNLKHEIETGLIQSIIEAGAGEVLGDFVALADRALDEQQKDVASVLAAAALEDTLKRNAAQLGLQVEDKDLSTVVSALKSKGFFKGAETKIVPTFVTLRNQAMHAQWEKISGPDVASLLGYLKSLLAIRK
jgi:hypothetical protein